MLRGRSPWGLGGAVYLLVYSFIRLYSFIRRYKRLLMLLIEGQGMLDSVYIRKDYTGLE